MAEARLEEAVKLRVRAERLATPELSHMGRIGRDLGSHELIEERYIIVYEVRERESQVRVISVVHGARARE